MLHDNPLNRIASLKLENQNHLRLRCHLDPLRTRRHFEESGAMFKVGYKILFKM